MHARSALLTAAVSSALLLSACETDEPVEDDVDDPVEEIEDTPAAAAVDIVDNDFEPAELEVDAGETIEWTNTGDAEHTVTFAQGPDSGELASGETFNHVFDEPGDYDYVCSIHSGMEGTITVSE